MVYGKRQVRVPDDRMIESLQSPPLKRPRLFAAHRTLLSYLCSSVSSLQHQSPLASLQHQSPLASLQHQSPLAILTVHGVYCPICTSLQCIALHCSALQCIAEQSVHGVYCPIWIKIYSEKFEHVHAWSTCVCMCLYSIYIVYVCVLRAKIHSEHMQATDHALVL